MDGSFERIGSVRHKAGVSHGIHDRDGVVCGRIRIHVQILSAGCAQRRGMHAAVGIGDRLILIIQVFMNRNHFFSLRAGFKDDHGLSLEKILRNAERQRDASGFRLCLESP